MAEPMTRPAVQPRLMTAAEAAAHCRVSEQVFRATIGAEVPPLRLRSCVRWDRRAIDRHLDRLSGLDASSTPETRTLRRPGDVRAREASASR